MFNKLNNKHIVIRASKGYKQPIKSYDLDNVLAVDVNFNYNEWVVVLKDKNKKEYFLIPGYKIKILSADSSSEPAASEAPKQPVSEPTPVQPTKAPAPQPSPQGNIPNTANK